MVIGVRTAGEGTVRPALHVTIDLINTDQHCTLFPTHPPLAGVGLPAAGEGRVVPLPPHLHRPGEAGLLQSGDLQGGRSR